MRIHLLVDRLKRECNLVVPEGHRTSLWLQQKFASSTQRSDGGWLIPCRHVLQPPASVERIAQVEKDLGSSLPDDLRQFLLLSNGADLFVVEWRHTLDWSEQTTLYHIKGASELRDSYHTMLEECRRDPDPQYRECTHLNYAAFCDMGDGDYLAALLEGTNRGSVIYVDRGFALGYHPYDDWTCEGYRIIADSFENWLQILINTNGWGGLRIKPPF